MFKKATRLQDSKGKITPPGSPFLERTLLYVYKIDFCYIKIKSKNQIFIILVVLRQSV